MKSYELQCIDYAVYITMKKGEGFNKHEYIAEALKQYYFYNHEKGFTSNEGARGYIENLTKEDIEKELLIEMIKKQACATKKGYPQKLSTNKTFDDDDITKEDIELLLIGTMNHNRMEVIKYLLDKYPKIVNTLIDSFVDARYFSPQYGMEQLDQYLPYYQSAIDKIESYYAELKENKQSKQY